MRAYTEDINNYEHFSPSALAVGAPDTDGLHDIARAYAGNILDLGGGLVSDAIDLSGRSCMGSYTQKRFVDTVKESLPPDVEQSRIHSIGISMITNAQKWQERLGGELQYHSIAGWHTDAKVLMLGGRTDLIAGKESRLVLVFGGEDSDDNEGTEVMEGDVRTEKARRIRFSSAAVDLDDLDGLIGGQHDQPGTLVGSDWSFLRGPIEGVEESPLEGDYSVRNLPIGVWSELSPKTVHKMSREVSNGRICLTLSMRN